MTQHTVLFINRELHFIWQLCSQDLNIRVISIQSKMAVNTTSSTA